MKTIGIIGPGYVGQGVYRTFGDQVQAMYSPSGNSVNEEFKPALAWRKNYPKGKDEIIAKREARDTKEAINKCDLVVICAPTPMAKDGSCNWSAVEDAVKWITAPFVLIKSTIPPGTTEYLNKTYGERFAFSPEYMGEGGYFTPFWKYPDPKNMIMHSFQIFGGPRKVTNAMVDIFIRKMGPHVFYAQTDSRTAEVVKHMENSWGGMKVTFVNEWYEIAKAHGVDYREVRELWALDERVEKMHTAVFPDKRGFGGKCFPKDINSIVFETRKKGYEPEIMAQILKSNAKFVAMNERGGDKNMDEDKKPEGENGDASPSAPPDSTPAGGEGGESPAEPTA